MAACTFHFNRLLDSMTYVDVTLTLVLKKEKPTKHNETWVYAPVPSAVAYELFYTKTGKEAASCYNKKIKGKFKVIEVRT